MKVIAIENYNDGRGVSSIRRQRDLVVDQGIQRRLHINLGVDHAGLLQGKARGEDRFTLRRTASG